MDLSGRNLNVHVEVTGTAEAVRELKTVDAAVDRVGTTSNTTGARGLQQLMQEFERTKVEAAKLGEEIKKTEASTVTATRSFSGMMSGLQMLGAAGAAAFVGLGVESSRYYLEQQHFAEQHKAKLNELALAWGNFRYRVGEAILGTTTDMNQSLSAMSYFVDRAGGLLSNFIRYTQNPFGAGFSDLKGAGSTLGQVFQSPGMRPDIRRAGDISLTPTGGASAWGGAAALDPRTGLPMDTLDRQWSGERTRILDAATRSADADAKATVEFVRHLDEVRRDFAEAVFNRSYRFFASGSMPYVPNGAGASSLPDILPPGMDLSTFLATRIGNLDLPSEVTGIPDYLLGMGTSNAGIPRPGILSALSSIFGRNGAGRGLLSGLSGLGILSSGSGLGSAIGGGLAGFGIGSSVSGLMSSLVGASVLGPLAPIGAAAGVLGPLLGKLFGHGEEAKVNDSRDAFLSQFGGSGTGAGSGFAELAKQLHALGAQGDGLFNDVLSAKKMKDWESAVRAATHALDDYNGRLAEQKSLEGQIADLRDQLKVDWKDAAAILQKYGLSIDGLGKEFQQFYINADATQLLSDMQALFSIGADVGGVLVGLKEPISNLVQESIKFGTTIPENFRPYIEELLRAGYLTDANGEKLRDLAGIQWGDPVKTEADKITDAINDLVKKLDELIQSIRTDFPGAAAAGIDAVDRTLRGFRPPTIDVPINYVYEDAPAELGAATGGWISPTGVAYFKAGGFVPRGTDTIPAMLSPGEYVMRREAVDRIGVSTLSSMNRGVTINVGGISVDARHGSWENPASVQRRADQIGEAMMRRLRTNVQFPSR